MAQRGHGAIVNVGSIAGIRGAAGSAITSRRCWRESRLGG
jgi:NADP-dependent 3-hydroxy acid dehydrogenase YdfG